MKTITQKYNAYEFGELNQEAKDKAREEFNKEEACPFLQDDLREYIHEELQTLGLKGKRNHALLFSILLPGRRLNV
jgi:hypothetical protein